MQPMTLSPCATCRYYNAPATQPDSGVCHRFPVVVPVLSSYGCGEHKPEALTLAMPATEAAKTPRRAK